MSAAVRRLAPLLVACAVRGAALVPEAAAQPRAAPAAVGTVRDAVPPPGVSERDVTVGAGEWAVGGTLAVPAGAGPFPAVVLMHGSGPGRRDGIVGPNRVLRETAWALAARGVAVLRYDKRTDAHAARFRALGREATLDEEHTDDGVAAVRLLQRTPGVDPARVYILASSQSTGVAATVAERAGGVPGLVLAAVGGRSAAEMIIEQVTYHMELARRRGDTATVRSDQALRARAELVMRPDAPDTLKLLGKSFSYWRAHTPRRALDATAAFLDRGGRVLVLSGARDYLTSEADFATWRRALAGRTGAAFKRYPDLNHMMQAGVGKMTPAEYNQKMTISEEYLADVAAWVRDGVAPKERGG